MKWNMKGLFGQNQQHEENDAESVYERSYAAANGCLSQLFSSCSDDPRGSIHRAWGVSLLFILAFFIVSVVEMVNLQSSADGSKALMVAAVLTGIVHVLLGILGTFVLKRFPTSFSVGFFLGVLVILANQNLIMFGTFHSYKYGSPGTNHTFANLGLSLFCVLFFFTLLLFHFKKSVVVAPVDAKGLGGRNNNNAAAAAADRTDSSTEYRLDET